MPAAGELAVPVGNSGGLPEASGSGSALPKTLLRLSVLAPLRYGATTAFASLLALYLAILVELDQPYWAATTVLIVAQPLPGQVVGKGLYRALGTVTGAVGGLALVALFAQAPATFVAALALWIAVCTGVATLLRGFRTYGAMLSGYTAAIVALSALPSPDRTFDVAVARGSAILLGIMCGALLSALLIRARARDDLLSRVAAAISTAAALVGQIGAGGTCREARRRLVAELAAIELLGPVAAAEDLPFRRRLAGLAGVIGELIATLSALRAIDEHLSRLEPGARVALLAAERVVLDRANVDADAIAVRAAGRPVPDRTDIPVRFAQGHERTLQDNGADADQTTVDVGRIILADRLAEALHHLGRALSAQAFLLGRSTVRPTIRLHFDRDPRQAGRNALRAFLAVSLAGAFAVASAWSAGGTFLINIGVACSLFATQPRPSAGAFGFMRGATLALAVAFAVKFYILPWLDGFTLLALVLFPILVAGTVATTVPGWLGTATAFNVLFLSDLAPVNVITYDPAAYLDGGVATLAAFAVGGTVFRVVLPSDPARTARRLAAALRRDIAALATGRVHDEAALHSVMYDRVGQVVAATTDRTLVEGSISTLGVASEVARLRSFPLPEPAADAVRQVLSALFEGRSGAEIGKSCDAAAEQLRLAGGDPNTHAIGRALAALASVRDAVAEHPDFYQGGFLR